MSKGQYSMVSCSRGLPQLFTVRCCWNTETYTLFALNLCERICRQQTRQSSLRLIASHRPDQVPAAVSGDGNMSGRASQLFHAAVPLVHGQRYASVRERFLVCQHLTVTQDMLRQRLTLLRLHCNRELWLITQTRREDINDGSSTWPT